jgi:hypothetical protein
MFKSAGRAPGVRSRQQVAGIALILLGAYLITQRLIQ